jgi:hypothetical protein
MVGSLTTTILPDGPALRLPRLNRLTKVRKSRKVQIYLTAEKCSRKAVIIAPSDPGLGTLSIIAGIP